MLFIVGIVIAQGVDVSAVYPEIDAAMLEKLQAKNQEILKFSLPSTISGNFIVTDWSVRKEAAYLGVESQLSTTDSNGTITTHTTYLELQNTGNDFIATFLTMDGSVVFGFPTIDDDVKFAKVIQAEISMTSSTTASSGLEVPVLTKEAEENEKLNDDLTIEKSVNESELDNHITNIDTDDTKAADPSIQTSTVKLQIDNLVNFLFDTYSIDIYADNSLVGTLGNGDTGIYEVELTEGTHEIIVTKENDLGVEGRELFIVSGETLVQYKIDRESDHIKINTFTTAEQTEAVERTISAATAIAKKATQAQKETEAAETRVAERATEEIIQKTASAQETLAAKEKISTQFTSQIGMEKFPVKLDLKDSVNLFFDKYSVDVFIDDTLIGTIKNGDIETFEAELVSGSHVLKVTKENDSNVYGEQSFSVPQTLHLQLEFNNESSYIGINQMASFTMTEIVESTNKAAETTFQAETQIAVQQTKSVESTNIAATRLFIQQTEEMEKTSSAATQAVAKQTAEEESRFATESAEKNKTQLEITFPLEMAKRVAIVAMTNSWATDVFMEDGNTYDPTKFHSYADLSGFYMTVYKEGTWSVKDLNAWHVEKLILRPVGYSTYLQASMDIIFNGDNYVVSGVKTNISNLEYLDSTDPTKTNHEEMEPGEHYPYLTVPHSLIASDRDLSTAPTPTVDIYQSQLGAEWEEWVDKQFSSWDSAHAGLVDLVKRQLNDERSFEYIGTDFDEIISEELRQYYNAKFEINGLTQRVDIGDLVISMRFTAKNNFNATMKYKATGIARYESNMLELIAIENVHE